jgi:hypothetical protein
MFLLRTIAAALLLGGAIASALAFALRRGASLGRIAIDGAASIVGGFAGGALFVPLAAAFPHSRSGGQIGDWSGFAYAVVTGAFLGATAGGAVAIGVRGVSGAMAGSGHR